MSIRDEHRRRVMALEAAAAAMMLSHLSGLLDGIAARFGRITAAAGPEDGGQAAANLDDLAALSAGWHAEVDETVAPYFRNVYRLGARQAAEQVAALGVPVPDLAAAGESMLDQTAADYLANARPRFYALGDAAWTAARDELVVGFAAGEGIEDLRARIRDVTDLSRNAADALARTEVIAASNLGADARVALMGDDAPPFKQWLATMDNRTRPSHRHADGQVVPFGDRFQVGDAHLRVPGDPAGPAGEVINCRCTTLYVDTADGMDLDQTGRGQGGITAASIEHDLVFDRPAPRHVATLEGTIVADVGPPQVDTTTGEPHTGAMIALVPADPQAWVLDTDGAEPADALHLTLAFLGEATAMPQGVFTQLQQYVAEIAAGLPPVDARVFGAAVWNTTGDTPSLVLSIGGPQLDPVHAVAWHAVEYAAHDGASEPFWPTQHAPWVAHMCLAYNPPAGSILALAQGYEGPIVFDRIRLTYGSTAYDYPLSALTATEAPMDQAEFDDRMAHIRAAMVLTAASPAPTGMGDGPPPQPGEHLRSLMHVEGKATGLNDTGRIFTNLTYRDTPFAFHWQKNSSAHGGQPVVVPVGLVTRVVEDGDNHWGFVQLDLGSLDGQEFGRQVAEGFARWVSIGADETRATVTLDWPEPGPEPDPDDPAPSTEVFEPLRAHIDGANVAELTAVSTPAQADATVEPTPELLDALGYGTPPDGPDPEDEETPIEMAAAATHDCGCGGTSSCRCDIRGKNLTADVTPADMVQAVTAAAYTIELRDLPPAAWFEAPHDVPMGAGLTISPEGRIWGLLAPLGTGHRAWARSGSRLEAPFGNVDYDRFMGPGTMTDAGRIPAGPLTMDCGHAAMQRANHQVAREHYDNACSIIGAVAVGEDRTLGGIWIAGALLPGVSADKVARALMCRCSGDWQPHPDRPGWSELVATLLVPSPGFATAAAANITIDHGTLVASSVPVRYQQPPGHDPDAHRRAAAVRWVTDAAGRNPADRVRRALGV